MNKSIAIALKDKAKTVALNYSSPDRDKNANAETFEVSDIVPLSEYTAAVYFKKNTGKLSVAFFYWVNQNSGYWQYFFPTDSHLLGFRLFQSHKASVEAVNYNFNFEDKELKL